ncbi:DUF1481 domain-containing protein [Vibrio sp. SCSIO 43140]|uniref:DUF1481 domain-containing protein n=1 Tax=Vibrio sp. SCSIO 43140 TaxID=2819100 RepID=UPI002074CF19|nr:DUF1481 domain-containing protein [Vibrio sp. SCSIO 43140]USD60616.1 DUF1481 domain-containing protein [Vibrio sp. SCSIO 43140]
MKKTLLVSLLAATLIGCSSTPSPSLNQFSNYTGGQTLGDATSFYWYTEKLTRPYSAADYVNMNDYGWYQSNYRWEGDTLREFVREGVQNEIETGEVTYRIHVRFNKDGEAIYQQYRRNGKVLPVKKAQLENYQREASLLVERVKEQDSDGLELVQGHWDGETLETCNGIEFSDIKFEESLPNFVVKRLAEVESYVAFLGSTRLTGARVEQLLMLAEGSKDCIPKPELT